MSNVHSSLVGAAGVYYVAARLNAMNLQCATTFGNVPSVDILVSDLHGSALVALQVKTTADAARLRGRGKAKAPHHYEWEIGPSYGERTAGAIIGRTIRWWIGLTGRGTSIDPRRDCL